MPSSAQRFPAARSTPARSGPPARSGRGPARPSRHRATGPAAHRPSLFDGVEPTVIDADNLPSFAELGLPAALVNSLVRHGISTPFPIQVATIPDALAGRDVLGRAATGAGKTLGFGLPMLSRLAGTISRSKHPRGLVLVPTRELAMQVTDSLAPLAAAQGLSLRLVAGGLPIVKQIQGLARGTDIVVATPGRLVDLIDRRSVNLSEVEVTVLDEADHMADLGFLPVVRQLLDLTPADGQRLLFSATLDGDVATLVTDYLTRPVIKSIAAAEASVTTMEHHVFRVRPADKWPVVTEIAAREGRTILFVRTKHGAERLATNLRRAGVAADALHGGRSQGQRTKALNQFKNGTITALVATDVAARGIHVDDISMVVHVDPPADAKDYLHRSGRTARAGEAGTVVSIATPTDDRAVRSLLNTARVSPQQRDILPGSSLLTELTGARRPSGVALPEPPPERSRYGNGSGGGRSGSGLRSGAGRPSRPTRPGQSGQPARGQRSGRAVGSAH